MTLEEMLKMVRILSNSCYVRWWAHFNYPKENPWEMAFSCIDQNGKHVDIDLSGIKPKIQGNVYVFNRLDENGLPYRSIN